MPDELVLIDIDGPTALVTLHRPEARNALSRALTAALIEAITSLDADPSVRAIVLTGAGSAFCAGLDLKELSTSAERLAADPGWRGPLPPRSTPLVGAINGVAATGGLELALACDFLMASTEARFIDTHTRVGVVPGWGLTVLLPERVGLARAREMSLTNRMVDAPTALDWGLVNRVVDPDALLSEARSVAADIAAADGPTTEAVLRLYDEVARLPKGEALAMEARASSAWAATTFDARGMAERAARTIARGKGLAATPPSATPPSATPPAR